MENKSTEAQEQIWLVHWFRLKYPKHLLFAIPNGGKRSITEALSLKRQGVTAGIPDLFLAVPRGTYSGLFIELKRTKSGSGPTRIKGKLSKEQRAMLLHLSDAGYMAVVAHGFLMAQEFIDAYLEYKC